MGKEAGASKSKWQASPEELVSLFNGAMESFPQAMLRKSFGYPSATINGHMITGLHQENLIVRLPLELREELQEKHKGWPFEPMPGRVMGEFMVLPQELLNSEEALREWIGKALDYVSSFPPKVRKSKKKP